jgi:hypothetical protein
MDMDWSKGLFSLFLDLGYVSLFSLLNFSVNVSVLSCKLC